jgi:hypothetical protein
MTTTPPSSKKTASSKEARELKKALATLKKVHKLAAAIVRATGSATPPPFTPEV